MGAFTRVTVSNPPEAAGGSAPFLWMRKLGIRLGEADSLRRSWQRSQAGAAEDTSRARDQGAEFSEPGSQQRHTPQGAWERLLLECGPFRIPDGGGNRMTRTPSALGGARPKGPGGAPHPLGTREDWRREEMRETCQNSLLTAKSHHPLSGP